MCSIFISMKIFSTNLDKNILLYNIFVLFFVKPFLKQNKIVKTLVDKIILYSVQQKKIINLLLLYFNQ